MFRLNIYFSVNIEAVNYLCLITVNNKYLNTTTTNQDRPIILGEQITQVDQQRELPTQK